jgi:hypothetical protein
MHPLRGLFEEADIPRRYFDLVLCIHSIFSFREGISLPALLSLPRNGGVVCIASNSADSFIGQLKAILDEGFGEQRYEVSDLKEELLLLGREFLVESYEVVWNVPSDDYARFREVFLEWLSLGRYRSLPLSVQRRAANFVEEHCSEVRGHFVFQEREEIVIVA